MLLLSTERPCCYCVYRMPMLLLCVQNDHTVIVCTESPCCYCVQNAYVATVCTHWWCYKFSQWCWSWHHSPWGDPTQMTGRNPGTNWVPVSKSRPISLMQAPLIHWYMYCPQLRFFCVLFSSSIFANFIFFLLRCVFSLFMVLWNACYSFLWN